LRVLSRLVLLAYLLVGLLPGGTFVICIDGKGSFALEAASQGGTCSDCSDSDPCSVPNGTGADSRCDCTDLVIAGLTDEERTVFAPSSQVDVPPASELQVGVALTPPHLQPLVRREPPRPPGTLRALRTVVLLV
jgi:hypothetical protein